MKPNFKSIKYWKIKLKKNNQLKKKKLKIISAMRPR